jgi:hypothetical protein
MAEKHKSKYKKPENTKYKSRKDLKDYTVDDKDGKLNPYSTKEKQSNVLRKTDKTVQDDGTYDVKYNADDRLYKDLEDGEYDAKHAAKVLKKRQDNEEKEISDVIKDKIENLTREQKERLVREYVRRKIVKVILEQATPAPEDAETEEPPAPIDAAAEPAPAEPAPTEAPAGTDVSLAPAPAPTPTEAPAEPTEEPTPTDAPAEPKTDTAAAEKQISPETKEALDLDRFVQYLKKQESVLGKLKKTLLAVNLSLKDVEPEDKASFYKMLKLAAIKQLDIPTPKTK